MYDVMLLEPISKLLSAAVGFKISSKMSSKNDNDRIVGYHAANGIVEIRNLNKGIHS